MTRNTVRSRYSTGVALAPIKQGGLPVITMYCPVTEGHLPQKRFFEEALHAGLIELARPTDKGH